MTAELECDSRGNSVRVSVRSNKQDKVRMGMTQRIRLSLWERQQEWAWRKEGGTKKKYKDENKFKSESKSRSVTDSKSES